MITLVDEFEVLGVPAPQGSKTAVTIGGKARVIQAGSKSGRAKHKAWRAAVAETARDLADDRPHDGPLRLTITFRLPMPKSRPAAARRAGVWPHSVKPDIDKLLRSTLDGMSDGGLIADDARVCAVEMDAWEVIGWTGALITVQQVDLAEAAYTMSTVAGSGVWYCRTHSGIVNEDERHGEDDLCPWHEHDAEVCRVGHERWHCEGACSRCDWVELTIPEGAA